MYNEITDFDGGFPGKEIWVYINDVYTTLDFTSSYLNDFNGFARDYKSGGNDIFIARANAAGNWVGHVVPYLKSFINVTNSAQITNVTGDGTAYTLAFNTEPLDNCGDYNNSTYTFTAPNTGPYLVTITVLFSGLASSAHDILRLAATTSTGATIQTLFNPYAMFTTSAGTATVSGILWMGQPVPAPGRPSGDPQAEICGWPGEMAPMLTERLANANNTLYPRKCHDRFRSNDELHADGPETVSREAAGVGAFRLT